MSIAQARRLTKKILFYLALGAFALLWLVPVIIMVFTALKDPGDLASHSVFAPPLQIRWENFSDAWNIANVSTYAKNSFLICVTKVPFAILLESLAAFSLSRLRLPFSRAIFTFFLIGLIVPVQMTLVPLTLILREFDLIDSLFGLFLIYLGFSMPFGILVLRGFFRTVPRELDEAATIDGCSSFGLYWRIMLPLAMPAIASLFILDFVSTWNEFLLAQIFLHSDQIRTIPLGLINFTGLHSTLYDQLSAAQLLSIIPVLTIYLFFQRYFVTGLAGAVKH